MANEKGLVVTLDDKGEPTKLQLNGSDVFATSLVLEYRANTPSKVTIEAYVQDLGGALQRSDNGDPKLETHELYAVSKADYDLLQSLKNG